MALPISLTKDEFRLLTWSSPELTRMTIQPQSLQRHCPLDNGLYQARADCKANNNNGDLDALPLEITQAILSVLDLRSLTDFRALSWRARALVDCFPAYKEIIQHSPDALRALLSTRMAVHFTAPDILDALCAQACFGCCGEFGHFLDLFTGRRCCVTCVINAESLLCVTAASAKRKLRMGSKMMRELPTLLSLPGEYSESERTCRKRVALVRVVSATAAAAAARSMQHDDSKVSHRRSRPSRPLRRKLPQPPQLHPPPVSTQMLQLQQSDSYGQNPYRFMAMIRVPTLDRRTGNVDWGVSCQSCRLGPRDERRGYANWNTVYTAAGYMEHFQRCQLSQIGRREVPDYIVPAGREQRMYDARFLGFLDHFTF